MSNTKINKILQKVEKRLKQDKYSFSAIYLFGSFAKNEENKWSDIDLAVISDNGKQYLDKNFLLLSRLTKEIDDRIESHSFTQKEFENPNDPLVHEIKTTGIKIV